MLRLLLVTSNFIADGTINGGTGWVHITRGNVAIGVSALEWTQFTAPTQTLAGAGLFNSQVTEVSVGTAGTDRIVVNADDIDLATVNTSKSVLTSGPLLLLLMLLLILTVESLVLLQAILMFLLLIQQLVEKVLHHLTLRT